VGVGDLEICFLTEGNEGNGGKAEKAGGFRQSLRVDDLSGCFFSHELHELARIKTSAGNGFLIRENS
jgi:hypothetical protein